jgi:hypothetical protein
VQRSSGKWSVFAASVALRLYRVERGRSSPLPRAPDRGKYKSIHQRQLMRLVGYDAGLVEDRRSKLGSSPEHA